MKTPTLLTKGLRTMFRTITMGTCLAALFARAALGQSCTGECDFEGDYMSLQTGAWNATATWCECDGDEWGEAGAKPGSGNAVIISRGTTVTVDSASEACDDLTIRSAITGSTVEGVLRVAAGGGQLSVNGVLNMQTPDVGEDPCRIEFTGSGSPGLLTFNGNATADREIVVDGPGKIVTSGSYVLTVSSTGIIKGASGNTDPLEIAGIVENDGDISITEAFNLKLTGGGLAADSSGDITVDHASGSVQWLLDSSALDTVSATTGNVFLYAGTLNFDTPIEFHGSFLMENTGIVDTEGLTGSQMALFCEGASCS